MRHSSGSGGGGKKGVEKPAPWKTKDMVFPSLVEISPPQRIPHFPTTSAGRRSSSPPAVRFPSAQTLQPRPGYPMWRRPLPDDYPRLTLLWRWHKVATRVSILSEGINLPARRTEATMRNPKRFLDRRNFLKVAAAGRSRARNDPGAANAQPPRLP